MRSRWWYRGEKEQTINKVKLFISKTIIRIRGYNIILQLKACSKKVCFKDRIQSKNIN